MKAEKRTREQYNEAFKRDAVGLVTEQGYKVSEACRRLGVLSYIPMRAINILRVKGILARLA